MTTNQAASVYIVIGHDTSGAVLSLQLSHHTMVPANHRMAPDHNLYLLLCRFQTVEQTVMDGTHSFPEGLDPLVNAATDPTSGAIAHDINPCQKP